MQSGVRKSVRVVVTTPIEDDLLERIRSADERIELVVEHDLLATPRFPSDHPFAAADERWEELLDSAEVLLDFGPLELAPQLASRPRLRWIQATSAGVGRLVERVGLRESPVVVTTASGVHGRALAEFALLAMLMFAKDVLRLSREQREHHWQLYAVEELAGKVVCIVGLGRIGRETARLARALDLRTVGTVREVRDRSAEDLHVERLLPMERIDELLPEADFVVLATPHTQLTHHLLDARRIALLKPSAILVNIARGEVVDEQALIEALQAGRLRGAALDVFEREPLPPDSPLWDLPNVFVSPHSASTVAAENARIVDLFVENLRRYLDGAPLINVLDKDQLY